ncbi:TPA: hypothetical protein ACGO3V_000972, partial [Streptococcus suis]
IHPELHLGLNTGVPRNELQKLENWRSGLPSYLIYTPLIEIPEFGLYETVNCAYSLFFCHTLE